MADISHDGTPPNWNEWRETKEFARALDELASNSWLVIETEDGPTHVVPHCDLRDHEVDTICWCRPKYDEGVMIHNSLDQREKYERGEMLEL